MIRPRRFRTRLVLAVGGSVVLGLIASLAVALYSTNRLSEESSSILRDELSGSSHAYLQRHIEDIAEQTHLWFQRAIMELEIAASATESMIEHEQELAALAASAPNRSMLADELEYRAQSRLWMTRPDEPCATTVWGYLLDREHRMRPDVRGAVALTALGDVVYPAVQRSGSDSVQLYYVGPPEAPYTRLCPWQDIVSTFDRLYPGYNEQNFWDFFFPGLVEGWTRWAAAPGAPDRPATQATFVAPYEDAAGRGKIMSLLRPVWRRDHTLAGAVGLDLTLARLSALVEGVQVVGAGSGFAFLAQQSGNVLAINRRGEEVLRLSSQTDLGSGVSFLDRSLARSGAPAVAALQLTGDDDVRFDELAIDGEAYLVVLKRLPAFQVLAPGTGIVPERWTLGFVVPRHEIFAALTAAEGAISRRTHDIVSSQLAIAGVTLALMLMWILLLSRRMTHALQALAEHASRIRCKDYSRNLVVDSGDEIGHMASAFNEMSEEIQRYTRGLERLVDERTQELRKANEDISVLNERLRAENLRMGAELDVARRLQRMVLPQPYELRELPELEVAALMQPATEVGGDYYDVLRLPHGVHIGIGDVTGHGIEAGVLMLMVQTAIRTLVAAEEHDLGRMMAVVNQVLHENIQRSALDHSATLSLLELADTSLRVTGQHEDVIVIRRDGAIERVSTMGLGFPVGVVPDIQPFVAVSTLRFDPGDVLILYTDGVTEAENPAHQQYGIESLCAVLDRHRGASASEITDAVLADLVAFMGSRGVLDDITLFVAKRL